MEISNRKSWYHFAPRCVSLEVSALTLRDLDAVTNAVFEENHCNYSNIHRTMVFSKVFKALAWSTSSQPAARGKKL